MRKKRRDVSARGLSSRGVVIGFDHRTERAGRETLQAAPAAAHIDKGTIAPIQNAEGLTLATIPGEATATATTQLIVDGDFEKGLSSAVNDRHGQSYSLLSGLIPIILDARLPIQCHLTLEMMTKVRA